MQTIPLTLTPWSTYTVELKGRSILFEQKYNTRKRVRKVQNTRETDTGYWTLDLYEENTLLVAGIALMLGTDLLRGYNLNLGHLIMLNKENNGVDADKLTLGKEVILVTLTDQDIDNIQQAGSTGVVIQKINQLPRVLTDG